MFTKALILVLLGSSLVLASPVADPFWDWGDKFKELYNGVAGAIQGTYQSALNTVDEFYEKAKSTAAYASGLGQDALAYLEVEVNKAKHAILAQIKAVDDEAAAKIQKVEIDVTKGAKVIAYEIEQIAKQTQEIIDKIIAAAKQN